MNPFRRRQEEFITRTGEPLLLFSAPVALRSSDTEYEYRPDSDFFYMTGMPEPESAALLLPGSPVVLHLFVRPRDPGRETWDGPRAGLDGAVSIYGADQAHPIDELQAVLLRELRGHGALQVILGRDAKQDQLLAELLEKLRSAGRSGALVPVSIKDARVTLHEMRLRKDPHEIELLRRAAQVTAAAHRRGMAATRPGLHEYEVAAEVEYEFRRAGMCAGYPTIVGSGPNSTILHYTQNRRMMEPGDLVLVDAGAEHACLTADLTRTWPANGRFTPEQRVVYELVLAAHRAAIATIRPGVSFDAPHERALSVLVGGLIELGLLVGSVEDNIEGGAYRRFFMHRTSHWLGMDVHDPAPYKVDQTWRCLEAGMVLTVEPGLYFPQEDAAIPASFRGIGIRLEDDILVTETGIEVLTAAVPTDPDEVLAQVGTGTPGRN